MTGRSVHRASTQLLSIAMAVLGVALIVQAATVQGNEVLRLVLGILFLAAGCGRLYVQARGRRQA